MRVIEDRQEELWAVQQEEFNNCVRMSVHEVYDWCDAAPTRDGKASRYSQISMALQYPVVVFYRIEGTKFRGFRFGDHGSDYMSLYSDE